MMASSLSALGLLVVCVVGLSLAEESTSPSVNTSDIFAVDKVIDDNQHIQFAYFSQDIKTIDTEFKNLLIKQRIETIAYITKVVDAELKKPGSTGFYGWLMVGKKLISLGQKQKKERSKLNQSYPAKREYNKETNAMILTAINESKARAKDIKELPRLEFRDKLLAYSHALQEAINNSPVGPYLKFTDSYIDGVKFTDLTKDIVAGLRGHGFGNHLNLVSALL